MKAEVIRIDGKKGGTIPINSKGKILYNDFDDDGDPYVVMDINLPDGVGRFRIVGGALEYFDLVNLVKKKKKNKYIEALETILDGDWARMMSVCPLKDNGDEWAIPDVISVVRNFSDTLKQEENKEILIKQYIKKVLE